MKNPKKHRTLAAVDADAKRAQDDDVRRKEKEEAKRLKSHVCFHVLWQCCFVKVSGGLKRVGGFNVFTVQ